MNNTSSFTTSTGDYPMSALTPAMRRAILSAYAADNFNGYLRCSRRTGQALIEMGLAEATPLKYERLTLAGQNLYCDRL